MGTRLAEATKGYPWSILVIAILAQAGKAMANQGVPALIPFLQATMGLTRAQVGLFSSANQLGQISSLLPGGWATDAFGVRRMLIWGQVGVGLGLLALAGAGSLAVALLALFVAGLASGMGSPAVSMAIIHWFPARSRGTAMGLKQTGVPIVGLLAASTLPSLALAFSWRHATAVLAAAVLATALATFIVYRDPPARSSASGFRRTVSRQGIAQLAANKDILLASGFALVLVGTQFSLLAYLMLYLKETLGMPVVMAGLVLALLQLGGLTGRVVWGLVSDRLLRGTRKPVLCATGSIAAAVLVILGLAPADVPWGLIPPLVFILGFSALGWHGIHQTLVPELAAAELGGTALGLSMTISTLGPLVVPPLFGYIADATGSYRLSWLSVALATALISAAIAVFMGERRRAFSA